MNERTPLYRFKNVLEDKGMEHAIKLLAKAYPTLEKQPKNNPPFGNGTVQNSRYFYNPYRPVLTKNANDGKTDSTEQEG
jgi:hypothetical protein